MPLAHGHHAAVTLRHTLTQKDAHSQVHTCYSSGMHTHTETDREKQKDRQTDANTTHPTRYSVIYTLTPLALDAPYPLKRPLEQRTVIAGAAHDASLDRVPCSRYCKQGE